ncbi:MAG TPA: 2-hydroxyacid dehydrogenase [Caulobacteraceae bacterium]
MKPTVLLSHEMLAALEGALSGSYEVLKRWETPDLSDVQAIVHAGEFVLEPAFLATMPRLGLIACVSVGYDGVPVDWCAEHGVAVTHSVGINADDVADVAVGSLIGVWRGLFEGDRRLREGRWTHADRMRPRPSLKGKKVGIVGLGHIGEAVARRVEAMGMVVSWWGPRPKEARWPRADSLLQLAQSSDVLAVCCKADASNRRLISREVIAALGPRGCLVNVSRGSVVDEDALIAALKDGRLGMAALDVFETEPTPAGRWADVPNTVLTPHMAGGTLESIPLMVGQTLENLRRFFAGEPLATPVQA